MHRYSLNVLDSVVEALRCSHAGIRRALSSPFDTNGPGVGLVQVELANGQWLVIGAEGKDLEAKLEVFPFAAGLADRPHASTLECSVDMPAPVSVSFLETEDWLDPTVECSGALGSNPIPQCQGRPGTAPPAASASCHYVGGFRFFSATGVQLVVAKLAFPYSSYCSAFPQRAIFDSKLYVKCVVV